VSTQIKVAVSEEMETVTEREPCSKYKSVLLVCRNNEWAQNTVREINKRQKGLSIATPSDSHNLSDFILCLTYETVIIDVHLTNELKFDGLILARELLAKKPNLQVIIKSDITLYSADEFFSLLIHKPVQKIGCDVNEIVTFIFGKEN